MVWFRVCVNILQLIFFVFKPLHTLTVSNIIGFEIDLDTITAERKKRLIKLNAMSLEYIVTLLNRFSVNYYVHDFPTFEI